MPIDAFGYKSLTVLELIEGITDVATRFPALATAPVWVKGHSLFMPVRNVIITPQMRTVLEVHLG